MSGDQRPVARGRGRGGPSRVLTEEEKHGFAPGFDWKNLDQSAKTLQYSKTLTGGRGLVVETNIVTETLETGIEYAKRIRAEEEEKAKLNLTMAQDTSNNVPASNEAAVMDFEDVSTVMERDTSDSISLASAFIGGVNPAINPQVSLPIETRRNEILKMIKLNQITVIEGKTGCGKTTRVPMFIAEDACQDGGRVNFNIVVTQPRRIAAVSVATRVAEQKGVQLGGLVGYQIGMDRNFVGEGTRLLYCTTGVLLQKLITTKSLGNYTHIIIDEVHERNVDTDLLLMVIRKLLWMKPQSVKLVLMSATFESEKFMEYFKLRELNLFPAKVSIDQEPAKLTGFYLYSPSLTDIVTKHVPKDIHFDIHDPILYSEVIEAAISIIDHLSKMERNRTLPGAVLVFLPGLNEIKEMENRIKAANLTNLWILPLHSSVTDIEQQRVFQKPQAGLRKVILATNIAESSITVPDVEYVIDFCLTKNLVMEAKTNFPMLQLEWASQANCIQRAGRAGRTKEGRYIRMIPAKFWNDLKEHPDPEIKRTPLELCVLRVKKLDMGPAKELLGLCPDPPELQDIRKAILRLKRIGGLCISSVNCDGKEVYDEEDGYLTSMGDIMAKLPIDVNLSKLILIGYAFGYVHEAIEVAACLTIQSMFSRSHGQDLESYMSRLAWANQSYSDLFASLTAYELYGRFVDHLGGYSKRSEPQISKWCRMNCIQEKRIREVTELVADLKKRLFDAGISLDVPQNLRPEIGNMPPGYEPTAEDYERENKRVKELLLKIALCGAFYPNYFISNKLNPDSLNKMVPSQSHLTSVQIGKLPQNQGVLYADQIKALFSVVSDSVDCDFEDTKAILTFSGSKNPLQKAISDHNYLAYAKDCIVLTETAVKRSVYIAIKMRQIRYPLEIKLLKKNEVEAKMKELEEIRSAKEGNCLRSGRFVVRSCPSVLNKPVLPTPNEVTLHVYVTAVADECGIFWARKAKGSLTEQIEHELFQLSCSGDGLGELSGFPKVGDIVRIVPATHDIVHVRGRVVRVPNDKNSLDIDVLLIDYGEVIHHKFDVKVDKILDFINLPEGSLITKPPQAFQCQIEGIKPAVYRNPHGVWENEAVSYFRNFFMDKNGDQEVVRDDAFEITVYSVVNNVVRVWEVENCATHEKLSLQLVQMGFAESDQPSDRSKRDHDNRSRVRENDPEGKGNLQGSSIRDDDEYDVGNFHVAPNFSQVTQKLSGPTSPLELSFHGANRTTHGTRIAVSGDSVNSVALESEPYSAPTRILVAGSVAVGSTNNQVTARETTLMPPIPGLLSLVCLLFSPRVELRTDRKKLVYIGALCGIGSDERRDTRGKKVNVSRDHKNDIEVDFDVFITPEDMTHINVVRYLLNSLLVESGVMSPDGRQYRLDGDQLFQRQSIIRSSVLKILKRQRMSMDSKVESLEKREKLFEWGLIDDSELQTVQVSKNKAGVSFLPLIKTVREMTEYRYLKNLYNEHGILQSCVQTGIMTTVMDCAICGVRLNNISQLKSHIESLAHIGKYTQISELMDHAEQKDEEETRKRYHEDVDDDEEM